MPEQNLSGSAALDILYETRELVVCLKPAGVESEDRPAPGAKTPCVPGILREMWGRANAEIYTVHRLDTATGGVMVYAKTKAAAAALSRQVELHELKKEYRCVCAGVPEPRAGQMHDFLFKDSRQNKVFPVKSGRKGAKEALLDYEVLAVSGNDRAISEAGEIARAALCRVLLHTGRTHQIRVQFASRKHPLFGDGKYGSREKGALGLFCCSLTFTIPGEHAPRTFTALPDAALPAWAPFAQTLAAPCECSASSAEEPAVL